MKQNLIISNTKIFYKRKKISRKSFEYVDILPYHI